MTVTLKTAEDIAGMRVAGKLAADVLEMIAEHVKPGVTTEALDRICHDYIVDVQKAIPAPLNYKGFPKSICTSINHVVCHGIPGDKPLKDGDTLNIDVTVIKDGYHGDTSRMFHVGNVPVWAERLSQVTQECMYKAIELVKPGCRLGDIGEVIQKHAEKNGFSVVREFCGHGIGKVFHEEPQILHYGRAGTGMELKAGMTFTIEPMAGPPSPRTASSRHSGNTPCWSPTPAMRSSPCAPTTRSPAFRPDVCSGLSGLATLRPTHR
jgi:methionyl aminopeptidase